MTAYITNEVDLGAVADAIRAKTGGSLPILFPGGFVSEIASIPSGGGDPMDALYITDGKCRMVVDVEAGEEFYLKGQTGYNKNLIIEWGDGTTSTTDENFSGRFSHTYSTSGKKVITVYSSDASSSDNFFAPYLSKSDAHDSTDAYPAVLGVSFSRDISAISQINLPSITDVVFYYPSYGTYSSKGVGQQTFHDAVSLRHFKIVDESVGSISISDNAFDGTTMSLTTIELSNTVTSLGNSVFYQSPGLESLDLPASVSSIGAYAFYACKVLKKLIVRKTDGLVSLGASAFMDSGIAKNRGYIYVPDALVTDYQSATNWSSYSSRIKGLSELGGN